jgi:hypothetical protein
MWRHSLRSARIFPAAGADIVKGVALGVHCWLRHAIDGRNMSAQLNQEANNTKIPETRLPQLTMAINGA